MSPWVFATSQPTNIQRISSECSACIACLGVGPSGILLTCTFMHRVPRTTLNMFKIVHGAQHTKRMVMNENRWCSALDKQVTNDNE